MNNINTNLNKLFKYIAVGGTFLAYQAWYERIQNRPIAAQQQQTLTEVKDSVNEINEKLNKIVDDNLKNKLLEQNKLLENDLKKIEDFINNSNTDNSDVTNPNSFNNEIGEIISKNLERVEKIKKYLSEIDINKKFFDNNPFLNIYNDFKEYLSTLSVYELCILTNIFLMIFIFTCLITILFTFYGNYLIEKLSLEQKYPKLSSIIKLRVKLQHYYILTNSLFIFIALVLMGYINIITLGFKL
jgi:hypothetical protein